MSLHTALTDPARPVFLFGSTPPREGTSIAKAKEACAKFASRSAALATDGFIVYDIQDEASRTTAERPFPFRKTMDSALYASFFPALSGKQCVVYKSVVEHSTGAFAEWLDKAIDAYGHTAFNLVGAASSSADNQGMSLPVACEMTRNRAGCKFGCVAIAERHTIKGNEHQNCLRKMRLGAEWFITQGIFAAEPIIRLLNDYGDLCRQNNQVPQKIILTFAPCGRAKTILFVKWLGMQMPEDIEKRIMESQVPVAESVKISCELLTTILEHTKNSGVPLGVNVESLSIFKEEIDAAHTMFQQLQTLLLNSYGSPWAMRWFFVDRPLPTNREDVVMAYLADLVRDPARAAGLINAIQANNDPVSASFLQAMSRHSVVVAGLTSAFVAVGFLIGRSARR